MLRIHKSKGKVQEAFRLLLLRAVWAFNLTAPGRPCVCHLFEREHCVCGCCFNINVKEMLITTHESKGLT